MNTPYKGDRIEAVDSLRGFALAGILFTHMIEQFIASARPPSVWSIEPNLADNIVSGASFILLFSKFFSIFSLLFGISFGIMMRNAERRGIDFSTRFLWRISLLLFLGIAHSLIYRGDILTVYALLGFTLPLFYRLPTKWLLIIAGLLFLGLGRFIFFFIFGVFSLLETQPSPEDPTVIAYVTLLRDGSFMDVVRENLYNGFQPKYDFQFAVIGRGYVTLAYFLVGLCLVRIDFFDKLETFKPQILKTLKIASGLLLLNIGLAVATFMLVPKPVDSNSWSFVIAYSFVDYANISMTTVYICLFLLAYLGIFQKALVKLAPYGRMALTHYLLQSIIGTAILYGWGLGYLGKLHDWQMVLIGMVLLTLQITISRLWLERFKFGPLEWLWRCATYFKWMGLSKMRAPST